GVELPSGRDARHGRAFSGTSTGRRVGCGSAHFYRTGLEYGLQLLCIAEKYSARDAGSGHDLPLQLVAALPSDRIALRDHRPRLEFAAVSCRGLVLPD